MPEELVLLMESIEFPQLSLSKSKLGHNMIQYCLQYVGLLKIPMKEC